MPTVQEIVDRASLYTGLVNSGSELDLMVAFANEQYRDAQSMSECNRYNLALDMYADHAFVNLSNTIDFVRVLSVSLSGYQGYENMPLEQLSKKKLVSMQIADHNGGVPQYYCITPKGTTEDGNYDIALEVWPAPLEDCTVNIFAVATTTTDLVAADVPSAIPAQFHHSVIGHGVVAMCFDREGRYDRADVFWNRRDRALVELTDYANRVDGDRVDSFFVDDRYYDGPRDRDNG